MRVGISSEWVGTRAGGLETYSHSLVEALARLDTDNEYVVYTARRNAFEGLAHRHPNFSIRFLGSESRWFAVPFGLPFALWSRPVDLFHATSVVPPVCPARLVVTVHDLGFKHHPEFFPPLVRLRLKTLISSGARRAERIIAVSNTTKQDLVDTFGIPEEKIVVVYEGVSPNYRPIADDEERRRVLARYGIEGDYVLYVGRLHVRKNLVRLLQAFARIRRGGASHRLVLVGRKLFDADPLLRAIVDLGLTDEVLLPGHIPLADLAHVYSGATVFVYPSLFEGFGLPPLEAMACGTPVITSNVSSLPEVVGDAALLADPRSVDELANAMERLLADVGLRRRCREKGLARVAAFTWERTARETLAVYSTLLNASVY